MTKKILILGYGATGKEVAKLLAQRGDEVIVGQRTEPKDLFQRHNLGRRNLPLTVRNWR